MSQSLHENIAQLSRQAREPCEPVCYSLRHFDDSSAHILHHAEEQHLADGFAFLAQTRGGARSVAAVTVEQGFESRSLVVRVAANRTLSPVVVEGMRGLLEVVRECAGAGGEFLMYGWMVGGLADVVMFRV